MSDIPNTREITNYFHCAKCFGQKPEHVSPREWASLDAGFTPLGIQIWCKRCEANVLHMDFEGMKHPANTTRKRTAGDLH